MANTTFVAGTPLVSAWLNDVNVETYGIDGAEGDGVTDDTVVVLAALESGKVVDGKGLSYGVTTLAPSSFKGLVNATLVKLNPTASNTKTLVLEGLTDFVLRDVTIRRGGSAGYTVGTLEDYNGLRIEDCSNYLLERVLITDGGRGTAFMSRNCHTFIEIFVGVTEHYWQELVPASPVVNDDIIQSHWHDACYNYTEIGCYAENVTSGAAGNPATNVGAAQVSLYTRRAWGGCYQFSVDNARSVNIDQGFDFSGTVGNYGYTVNNSIAADCGTVGFKAANSSYQALFNSCLSLRCGYYGFFVSGKSELINPDPRDIQFVNCLAVDTGSNEIWPNPMGFSVEAGGVAVTFPRAVLFNTCRVVDNQVTPTTQRGFFTDIAPIDYNTSGYDEPFSIRAINCEVNVPGMTSSLYFSGIHHQVGIYTGDTGSDSLTTSTWTVLNLNGTDLYDPAALHNSASNNSVSTAKSSGVHAISCQASFSADATGERKIRIVVDGVTVYDTRTAAAHPTGKTYVSGVFFRFLHSGQTVTLQAWQDSGSTLTAVRADTSVSLALVN